MVVLADGAASAPMIFTGQVHRYGLLIHSRALRLTRIADLSLEQMNCSSISIHDIKHEIDQDV